MAGRGAARCIHVQFGYASLGEYLDRQLGYDGRAARERLRVAEALAGLPATLAALRAGELGWSAVRELSRVVAPETEVDWIDAARGRTCRQIESLVAGHRPGDLPSTPPDDEARRHVVRYEVSAGTLALLREAKLKLVRDAGCALDDDQVLLLMARQVLGAPSDAGRANYQIHLAMCEQCGAAWQQAGPERVDLTPAEAEVACCDGQLVHPEGRAPQAIPPAVRRAVLERDGHRCRVPGCRNCLVDVHHIDWRCEGGGHDAGLLCCLCAAHHAALHRGLLLIEGTVSTGLIFRHADGTAYGGPVAPEEAARRAEVAEAVRRMGARHDEAQRAVAAAATHVGREASFESLLKASLAELRSPAPSAAPPPRNRNVEDVESALRHMGCRRSLARNLAEAAGAHVGPDAGVEELLRQALLLHRTACDARSAGVAG